ncbi:unnamed protein product, partial [Staurois parvus]
CATFRSPHTAGVFHFVIGCWQITASHSCCQAPNLPWAPVPPPHAAARSTVSHGSLYGLPLLLSPSPHSAMCHFSGLLTLLVCSIFCHRVLADYRPPIAAAGPHGPYIPPPNLPWAPVP